MQERYGITPGSAKRHSPALSPPDRREFGFWRSLGRIRLSDLMTPEVVSGVLIGAGLAAALGNVATRSARTAVAGDYLLIAGDLLGIVFAGFALVIALLSDEYLRWLEETDSGVTGFLSPFLVSMPTGGDPGRGSRVPRHRRAASACCRGVVLRSHQRSLLYCGA
jgi:hypothetical protein